MDGMQMMLNALLKMSGYTIEDVKIVAAKAMETKETIEKQIADFDARLFRMEVNQQRIIELLEKSNAPRNSHEQNLADIKFIPSCTGVLK